MAQKFLSDIHPTAGLKDSSGDLGASGQVLSSTGSGTNWVQAGSGATVIHDDQFTATANQTAFTLSNTVDAENKTQVYIDGAYQAKAGYTVSGTTLTFDTGLDVGSKVEVITFATAIASNATAVIKLDEFVPGDAISGTSGQNFTFTNCFRRKGYTGLHKRCLPTQRYLFYIWNNFTVFFSSTLRI